VLGPLPCTRCGAPVLGRQAFAQGKLYHPECFTCGSCREPITGQYIIGDTGHPICPACIETPLAPAVAAAAALTAAPAAARPCCVACGRHIKDGHVVVEGRAYHRECFVCETCRTPISGSYVQDEEGLRRCGRCHEAARPVCSACGRAIVQGKCVYVDGRPFHSECFTCSVCGQAVSGSYVVPDEECGGRVLCERCHEHSLPTLCAGCCDRIHSDYIILQGLPYHYECFKCCACRQRIAGPFFVDGSRFLCERCHEAMLWAGRPELEAGRAVPPPPANALSSSSSPASPALGVREAVQEAPVAAVFSPWLGPPAEGGYRRLLGPKVWEATGEEPDPWAHRRQPLCTEEERRRRLSLRRWAEATAEVSEDCEDDCRVARAKRPSFRRASRRRRPWRRPL